MAVVVWLASFMAVMILQQTNNPEDKISMEAEFTFDTIDQEFVDYEETSFGYVFTWNDTIMITLICGLFLAAVCQFRLLWREIEEMKTVVGQCSNGDEEISVSHFYSDTECMIKEMNVTTKIMKRRYMKIKERMPDKKDLEQIKDDVDYLKDSWFGHYSAFSLLDFDLKFRDYGSDLYGELGEIRGRFDATIGEIDKYMMEDAESLNVIIGDVQMLERYFGK